MKALVLAGGSGTRLRPFSHSMAKQLFPVAGRPVLVHVIEEIRRLGVTEIGIVTGAQGQEIATAIGDGSRYGARITYVRQERPLGLAHAVAVAQDFLGDDDFVLYLGDNVMSGGVAVLAREFRERRPAAQVTVQRVADPSQFGVVELGADGAVRRLLEKPSDPPSDLAIIGVYFFTAAVHTAIASIRPSDRGELEITDALQWLLEQGERVEAREYTGYWKDTGRPDDILACNRQMLTGLRPRTEGYVDSHSSLSGAVVVEEGARVHRSRIEGPTIIGAGTVVEDCRIEPNTCVGKGCVLRSSRLADSIVLDDATIIAVPGLRGAIVGRSASIVQRPHTGDHRLVLGDHTSVELAVTPPSG